MEAEFRKHFTGKTVRTVIRLVRGRSSCKRVWGGAYLDIAAFVYIKVRLRLHLLLLMGLLGLHIKDFKFVPVMFVTLGFGSQRSLFMAIFPWLRDPNSRVQTLRVQRKTP